MYKCPVFWNVDSYGTTEEGLEWVCIANKVYITGYSGTNTGVVIPDKINNIAVVKIYESAFSGKRFITSITIPDSVNTIDDSAFRYCTSLKSITIPNSVSYIGDFVFSDCTSLTSVTIPNSVKWMGGATFGYCTSLTIYCEAESKPSAWSSSWNSSNRPVVWGYKGE